MASIRREIRLAAPADDVWRAVRDVGAVHRVLAPGFVADVRLEGEARIVTFGNGMVVRELIVDIDDVGRRLAYAAVGGRATHYHAGMEVTPEGPASCRIVWIIDLLPHDIAPAIAAMVEQAAAAITRTLDRPAPPAPAGSAPSAPRPAC
jgi:carbon monoxide dehydrogenase subunit G